jgi:hypothetical protein
MIEHLSSPNAGPAPARGHVENQASQTGLSDLALGKAQMPLEPGGQTLLG